MTVPASILAGQSVKAKRIADIKIEHRQRSLDPTSKEFKEWAGHIARLAASIKRVGLLHPITLEDGTDKLLTGFSRIQAFLKLGLEEIPFVYRSELSELDRKVIELEENLARLDLPMADRVKAIADIDDLQRRLAADKGEAWTTAKTAEITGTSIGTVSQAKKLREASEKNPELLKVLNTSGLVAALNKIKAGEALDKRKADLARRDAGQTKTYPAEVREGDALELIQQEPDESFDAVLTNFPFGIDLKIGKEQREIYKDGEDYIVKLVRAVTKHCYRVLRNDSWMLGFFDVRKITYSNKQRAFMEMALAIASEATRRGVIDTQSLAAFSELAAESMGFTFWLEEAGFNYIQVLPCIWGKPNKTQGTIGDPNKGFIMAYEAFVLAGKGEPFLNKKGKQNLFLFDTIVGADRDIDVQMPSTICTEIVSMICLGGSRILDPFAGSAAFGIGALNNHCSFVGYELSAARAEVGNLLLREHIHSASKVVDPEALEQMQRYLAQQQELREGGLT